jgi:hypothetical protein
MSQLSPTNPNVLDALLKERLELDIIDILAEIKGLELRLAMDIYYRSGMSRLIGDGAYGMQYLDARYLAEDIIENEPGLFA